jgi:hypothetical protein
VLPGQLRRQQGATAFGTLHHYKGSSQGYQQPVATGEVARQNPASRGKFADEQPLGTHLGLQGSVLTGINPLQGGAENTDRNPSSLKTTSMHGTVDSLRQTADDGPTRFGQNGAQLAGHEQAMV